MVGSVAAWPLMSSRSCLSLKGCQLRKLIRLPGFQAGVELFIVIILSSQKPVVNFDQAMDCAL
jgi:hypothetical protein